MKLNILIELESDNKKIKLAQGQSDKKKSTQSLRLM